MNDAKVKQQVVEKLKSSTNVLVTVSNNPSVDGLSAALGLTLMLNKLGKHATAVFSGAIPPAITFLDPEKTFESTVDSLRDFIIALDKEKADHLRYKVDGDVVKIFITPYRTTIGSDDLEFSQGDYNVELVMALGVDDQDHLDSALEAHGRILHDATVVTLTAGEQTSNLGSIDWHDDQASSLSEMLVGITESIKGDEPLLDETISTAFLTGIVAATDRFSNTHTTSRVMTLAAQLMAAGADQQLIAAKLQESHEIQDQAKPVSDKTLIAEDTSVKLDRNTQEEPAKKAANGELTIAHSDETLEDIANEVAAKHQEEAAAEAKEELKAEEARSAQSAEQPVPEPAVLEQRHEKVIEPPQEEAPVLRGAVNWSPATNSEPSLGGTLNATTEQAAEDKQREIQDDQNRTILTHSYLGNAEESADKSINEATPEAPESSTAIENDALEPETAPVVEAAPITPPQESFTAPVAPVSGPQPYTPVAPFSSSNPTLAELDEQNRSKDHVDALAVVTDLFNNSPDHPTPGPIVTQPTPTVTPQPVISPFDLPTPPPLPDFSTLDQAPPLADAYALDSSAVLPERLGDILAPEPNQQQQSQSQAPEQPKSNDPGQFKIPGQ